MARNKRSQSKHDSEVKKTAQEFKKKGFKVKADIKGFEKPSSIYGYRPDIIAEKGDLTEILEIETPDSVNSTRDIKQKEAFRKAARSNKNTRFKRRITK